MLSKIIVRFFPILMELGIWVILISAFIVGWQVSGLGVALLALIGAFFFCVMIFGALLAVLDIQKKVASLAASRTPASATVNSAG